LAISFISLIIIAPVSRPTARKEADDHLMLLTPAFAAAFLILIREKWANGSDLLPWLAGIFLVFAIFQFLSLSYIAAMLGTLWKDIFCIARKEERIKAEEIWKKFLNEKERFWDRLLASKTMALWPVFAAITAAILGLPNWTPKWQGDRSILVVTTGALAFYGQRRGAYEQAQQEFRIRALVTSTELAERDCEAERRKRVDIARNRANSERDREIERRKQEDLLAALNAEKSTGNEPSRSLGQLELFYSINAIRLNAVHRIIINTPNIVKNSVRKLLEMQSTSIEPGGNANSHERMAACLRDMNIFLRYIIYATFGRDSSILEERCINGLRETYLALNVPLASAAESIRIMKDLTSSIIVDTEGECIVEDVRYADYTPINTEIAAYFDLIIHALS
jgi:phycocyanin beta chain